MSKIIFPILLLLLLNNCTESSTTHTADEKTTAPAIPELSIIKNEVGYGGDIALHIQHIDSLSPEIKSYKLVSMYHGKPVGFIISIKEPLKKNVFVTGGITFTALKDTSNNFLAALAEIYEVKLLKKQFKDSLTISYTDLTVGVDLNTPGNWIAAQKKIFFETVDDSPELFLNIDLGASEISFPEKAHDYREGIIDALSKK